MVQRSLSTCPMRRKSLRRAEAVVKHLHLCQAPMSVKLWMYATTFTICCRMGFEHLLKSLFHRNRENTVRENKNKYINKNSRSCDNVVCECIDSVNLHTYLSKSIQKLKSFIITTRLCDRIFYYNKKQEEDMKS